MEDNWHQTSKDRAETIARAKPEWILILNNKHSLYKSLIVMAKTACGTNFWSWWVSKYCSSTIFKFRVENVQDGWASHSESKL
jgi:hypothetical protein